MVAYRVYCLDGAGQFTAADWVEADGDDEALEAARQLDRGVVCEVWDRDRLVGKVRVARD